MRPDEDPLDYSLACAMTHHDECEWGCRCWCHDPPGVARPPIKRDTGPFPLRSVAG